MFSFFHKMNMARTSVDARAIMKMISLQGPSLSSFEVMAPREPLPPAPLAEGRPPFPFPFEHHPEQERR
jgi:hypothetical protein